MGGLCLSQRLAVSWRPWDSSIVVVGLPTVLGSYTPAFVHASDHHRLQTDANDPAGDARAAGRHDTAE